MFDCNKLTLILMAAQLAWDIVTYFIDKHK